MIDELIEDCNNQIEWINKNDNMNVNALQFATYFIEQLKLVNNRTCSNCKHLQNYISDNEIACDYHCSFFNKDFYCNKWEAKDDS